MGNISTYSSPDEGSFTYTYDNQGQLTKAVNGSTTYTYSYDGAGNILSKSDGTASHSYSYTDYDWRDLLTAYDGQTISYDGAGNPTSYYNGTRWTFTWGNGRQLETASNGSSNLSYNYTADGIRTSKTANGVTHTYYYSGNTLLRETYGDTTLDFFYDANGTPAALKQNGNLYYYITNLQGDVIRLVDANGNTAALYKYDPFGNPIHASGSLATINPLRYRGYYYDTETGLYYCQSRYYDPVVGRFINADTLASTGQGFIGLNMFAYCANNPVLNLDVGGNRYIASTSVQNETVAERSAACKHQNQIAQEKSKREKETSSPSNRSSGFDLINLINAIGNNISFSFAIGQGLSFSIEVFEMGFDIGAYGNYGSWTFSHGKIVSGQEMYAGISTSLFGQEIGAVYHEFRENGTSEYHNYSWAGFNSNQDSFTIAGGSFYFLFAGFSYDISFNPVGFIIDLETQT